MVKGRAYDNLYARLEKKEGEKKLYRLTNRETERERCTERESYEG